MAGGQSDQPRRRVVIRRGDDGGCFVEEERLQAAVVGNPPVVKVASVWGADAPATMHADFLPAGHRFFPPPGGYRVTEITFAPAEHAPPGDEYAADRRRALPGYDEDVQVWDGLHASATVDVVHVAEGAITLRLAGANDVVLEEGDWVVQDGAMHAWHNHTDRPCRLVITMLGVSPVREEAGPSTLT